MPKGKREDLTDKQRRALDCYAGPGMFSIADTSRRIGMSHQVLAAWVKLPAAVEYVAALQAAKTEAATRTVAIATVDGLDGSLVQAARVEQEIACIAFADVTELIGVEEIEIVENGNVTKSTVFRVKNPKTLPEAIRRSIQSFRAIHGPGKGELRFECRLFNKLDALKILGLTTGLIEQNMGRPLDPDGKPAQGMSNLAGLMLIGPTKGKLNGKGNSS